MTAFSTMPIRYHWLQESIRKQKDLLEIWVRAYISLGSARIHYSISAAWLLNFADRGDLVERCYAKYSPFLRWLVFSDLQNCVAAAFLQRFQDAELYPAGIGAELQQAEPRHFRENGNTWVCVFVYTKALLASFIFLGFFFSEYEYLFELTSWKYCLFVIYCA